MSAGPDTDGTPRVYGVLCTYGRPEVALHYVTILDRQTRPPDVVYVVDNSGDPSLRTAIAERPEARVPTVYIDPGANRGPAGAFGLGFRKVLPIAAGNDIVVHLDDDDPPVADDQLEQLLRAFMRLRSRDARVAGIGLSGGTLQRRTGLVERAPSDASRFVDVDHLHGGYLPHYTVDSLASVDGNDETFFYGFEELELGLRLRRRGHRLVVDTHAARDTVDRYPKRSAAGGALERSAEGRWSRFHKERNLVRILVRERLWSALAFTVIARHVAKPIWVGLRRPRRGWSRLVLGMRATWSGLRGETGIDPRYRPPQTTSELDRS